MAAVEATVHTQLSLQEAAAVFQAAAEQARGFKAKFAERAARGRCNDDLHGYFTPRNNSPFTGLNSDEPDFSVAVGIAKGSFVGGAAAGDADVIHLYAWDRGGHRELQLYLPHGRLNRGRSMKLVQRFVDGYRQADQYLQVAKAPA